VFQHSICSSLCSRSRSQSQSKMWICMRHSCNNLNDYPIVDHVTLNWSEFVTLWLEINILQSKFTYLILLTCELYRHVPVRLKFIAVDHQANSNHNDCYSDTHSDTDCIDDCVVHGVSWKKIILTWVKLIYFWFAHFLVFIWLYLACMFVFSPFLMFNF